MGLFNDLLNRLPERAANEPMKPPLFEAIGRFVTAYASAESAVHVLARKLSGLSDEKARIIFGGMRLPDLSDIIRQIMRIEGMSEAESADIDGCLTQLSLIAKRRHSLVHRTTNVVEDKLFVTNAFTSRSAKIFENETIDHKELSDMHLDCLKIYLRLDRHFRQSEDVPDPQLEKWLPLPWRYKHVPPKTPNLKPRAKPAKQQRQPLASRETPKTE